MGGARVRRRFTPRRAVARGRAGTYHPIVGKKEHRINYLQCYYYNTLGGLSQQAEQKQQELQHKSDESGQAKPVAPSFAQVASAPKQDAAKASSQEDRQRSRCQYWSG